jgi:hypothetical protein
MSLSLHHGAITLGTDPIDVVVGIDASRIRLESNGSEIGDWSNEECQIVPDSSGSYLIVAENEELPFLPDEPTEFAAALRGFDSVEEITDTAPGARRIMDDEAAPSALTMVGFYLLAGVTSALGLWAVWSLVV